MHYESGICIKTHTHTPTYRNKYMYSFCLQFSVSYSTQHIHQ